MLSKWNLTGLSYDNPTSAVYVDYMPVEPPHEFDRAD